MSLPGTLKIKAMILAAGLGTRLKPFTDHHPKALFSYGDKTLLQHALEHLRSAGIMDVIINVHHYPGQMIDFVNRHDAFGMNITFSDETEHLLETGGGLKKAAWYFDDCDAAVVRNADILSDLDLSELISHHLTSGAIATLAVRDRKSSRYFLFDENLRLCGWENTANGDKKCSWLASPVRQLAFSGIQVISPGLLQLITEDGRFSLTDLYIRLAATQTIAGYLETGGFWADIGKAGDIHQPGNPEAR